MTPNAMAAPPGEGDAAETLPPPSSLISKDYSAVGNDGVLEIPALVDDVDTLTAALAYAQAGWHVLPVKAGSKDPGSVVGTGWPTRSSRDPKQIAAWFAGTDYGIALHIGRSGAVAFDVDNADKLPPLLAAALTCYPAPRQTTRTGSHELGGHFLYATPPGRRLGNSKGQLAGPWGEVRGRNGVLIVAPSIHAKADEGGLYRWARTGPVPPLPTELADALGDAVDSAGAATDTEVTSFLDKHTTATAAYLLDARGRGMVAKFATGESRHSTAVPFTVGAMNEAACGYYPAAMAADQLRIAFVNALTQARPGDPTARIASRQEANTEFDSILAWAVGQVTPASITETAARITELDPLGHERTAKVLRLVGLSSPSQPQAEPSTPPPPVADSGSEGPTAAPQAPPAPAPNPADYLTDKRSNILTNADQAAMLAKRLLTGRWAWCRAFGWVAFDGRKWEARSTEAVRTEIMQFYRAYVDLEHDKLVAKVNGWTNLSKEQQAYLTSLKGLLSKTALDAVVALAAGLVEVKPDIFDSHPDLLNARNGVVDLRTGELRPHDPALYMTKIAEVDYRPEAINDPGVAKVLECIPDDETRDWMQIRFGQAATGYPPPDDLLLVLHGGGANGKSTMLGGMQYALGDYAATIDDKVLLGDSTGHSTEKTALWGARLAICEEVPGGVELNTAAVKKITGSTMIKARKMRMDEIEWQPTHAMFLTSNNQLVVKATDHGTWRRLAKVTFPVRYRGAHEPLEGPDDRRGDSRLRARVEARDKALVAGFLAWIVEGARRWYALDRVMPQMPARVVKDTTEWRAETDLIMGFITECLEFDPTSHIVVTELYDEFKVWMEAAGMHPWSLKAFKVRFMEHSDVQGNRVATGRTCNHANLSRPSRMAHMTLPQGKQTVINGVAFRKDNDPGFRVHNGGQQSSQRSWHADRD